MLMTHVEWFWLHSRCYNAVVVSIKIGFWSFYCFNSFNGRKCVPYYEKQMQ